MRIIKKLPFKKRVLSPKISWDLNKGVILKSVFIAAFPNTPETENKFPEKWRGRRRGIEKMSKKMSNVRMGNTVG